MIYTFDRAGVVRLIVHTRAAKDHKQLYNLRKTKAPGLWLVGDDGVYLMTNSNPPLLRNPRARPEKRRNVVVYAAECNPQTLPFDTWYDNKRDGFGGDDGVEFIAVKHLETALFGYPPGAPLEIDVTPNALKILPVPSSIRDMQAALRKH